VVPPAQDLLLQGRSGALQNHLDAERGVSGELRKRVFVLEAALEVSNRLLNVSEQKIKCLRSLVRDSRCE
jgi:hypothetical protein